MRDRNLLFFEEDLDAQLRGRQETVPEAVNRIPKDQFLISNDQELVDHVVAGLTVEPLVLCEDATIMSQNETQVDVSGDSMRMFIPDRSGPFYIPGTRVDIDIPFKGEEWIFRYRTNPWSSVFPRAEVRRGRAIVKSCVWADHAAARSWRSPSTNLTPRMISARWFDPSSFLHFL